MDLYNEVAFTKITEEEISFLPGVYLEHWKHLWWHFLMKLDNG